MMIKNNFDPKNPDLILLQGLRRNLYIKWLGKKIYRI